jgi:ADP-ribose pyrophosphatase
LKKPPDFGSDFTEHTVDSKLAYEGGLLRVKRDDIRLPDGGTAWREYVLHPGAVLMLAFVDGDTVLLERQYRYPHRRHFIELPAGKLEPDEEPLATASASSSRSAATKRANGGRSRPCIRASATPTR